MTPKKRIVIFINGLPMYSQFDAAVSKTKEIIKDLNSDIEIVPIFNSYNLNRSQTSAAKRTDWMEKELNSKIDLKDINDNYNIYDIERYLEEIEKIKQMDSPSDRATRTRDNYYTYRFHPQWLLHQITIDNFLQSDKKTIPTIYVRIRPDRLQNLRKLILFSISNFEQIISKDEFYYQGYSCGLNDHFDNLEFNFNISDQQAVCNLNVLNKYKNLWKNLDKIYKDNDFLHFVEKCKKGTKIFSNGYNLYVNQETKLSFLLRINKIKAVKII